MMTTARESPRRTGGHTLCSVDHSFDDGGYAATRFLRSPGAHQKGTTEDDVDVKLPDVKELLFPLKRK